MTPFPCKVLWTKINILLYNKRVGFVNPTEQKREKKCKKRACEMIIRQKTLANKQKLCYNSGNVPQRTIGVVRCRSEALSPDSKIEYAPLAQAGSARSQSSGKRGEAPSPVPRP